VFLIGTEHKKDFDALVAQVRAKMKAAPKPQSVSVSVEIPLTDPRDSPEQQPTAPSSLSQQEFSLPEPPARETAAKMASSLDIASLDTTEREPRSQEKRMSQSDDPMYLSSPGSTASASSPPGGEGGAHATPAAIPPQQEPRRRGRPPKNRLSQGSPDSVVDLTSYSPTSPSPTSSGQQRRSHRLSGGIGDLVQEAT